MSIKRIPELQDEYGQFYSLEQIRALLGVSRTVAARLFCKRPGVINLSDGERPTYRVPASVLLEVMREHGYAGAQLVRAADVRGGSEAPGNTGMANPRGGA